MSASAYLFDTNVWVALAFASHPHHREATDVYVRVAIEQPAIFCRVTQLSFLRIVTTPAILRLYGAESMANRDALAALNEFMALPKVGYRDEPSEMAVVWHRLALSSKASPKLWMDAYLAAFAMVGGYQMVTSDKAFKQFKGLDLLLLSSKRQDLHEK